MRRPRLRSSAIFLAKSIVYLLAAVLILLGAILALIETSWAKHRLRDLIVSQANQYLTATLEIGRLEGSLLRGIQLGDVRLSRNGQALVTIDDVALSYSLRELWQNGTVIRRLRLTRPRVVASKMEDGRWDLGALVSREVRQGPRTGPGRPIQILAIEVQDATVLLRNPLQFGAAHVPTDFQRLDATFSLTYRPVTWTFAFDKVAFVGHEPELTVTSLSGGIGSGPDGWVFDNFTVATPQSAFTLIGRVDRRTQPTTLDLRVRADRFAFQEWSGVLEGLRNIAIEASFDTRLQGPLRQLATTLQLQGTGGSVNGTLVLDTSVPGWHGAGTLDVGAINLARWLSKPDKPSDITGRLAFNLDLNLGHFPRGTYTFDGPHAAFMGYAADSVHAEGRLTATEALITRATGVAYGANVSTGAGSSIGLDAPYPFHFQGAIGGIDLRRVPESIPVPRVESLLTFDYDVTGRFSNSYIVGRALFDRSTFLGATVGPGATGTIDTLSNPFTYSGDGELDEVSLPRFGQGLDVAWMREPQYAGTLSGRFHAQGAGNHLPTLTLSGGGRLARASLFRGTLAGADVGIEIARGTLSATYNGHVAHVDPAVALGDERFAAALTGTVDMRATVHDLLIRTPALADYDIAGTATLDASEVHGIPIERSVFRGALRDEGIHIDELEAEGSAVAGRATGILALSETGASALDYDFSLIDLAKVQSITGREAAGFVATKGRLSGPYTALRLAGDATITQVRAEGVDALSVTGDYDLTIPSGDLARAQASINGRASFPIVFGQEFQEASGTITMAAERIGFDAQLAQAQGRHAGLKGEVVLHAERRSLDVSDLSITFGQAPWRLANRPATPTVSWTDAEISIEPVVFAGGDAGDQRIEVSGTWRQDGNGALTLTGRHVFLETLEGAFEQPARYGGVLDLDAVLRGTRDAPIVTSQISIADGRVQRVAYQKLAGRLDYSAGLFTVELRLDQAPGVWITATGTAPLSLFTESMPERPIDLAIVSSPIDLGLVEGLTSLLRDVTGTMRIDMKAVGTSRDPHLSGSLEIAGAGFLVTDSGSRYKNTRASLQFSTDRIVVTALHVEDSGGHPLDMQGSLATHELKVGDLEIDASARRFEVLRNEFGNIEADATLQLRGRFDSPRVGGAVTISGGDLKVDRILERALFQPYATQPVAITEADAVAALNPWERLGLDIELHVPNTLKLSGENVQVATGTPIGLGDINLRVAGDLYLYKDPGAPAYITGSFDSVSGRYGFQGRNFEVDPASSINFRGDLNPEIYVTVTRVISGVETRVSIFGPLRSPELRLASTPPLDTTDILSLIVFNTSSNELSAGQQQELAVRAGALAAGFLTTPIISALQTELGLEILQIETGEGPLRGPRITIGDEIAPGLVARFSRQFGAEAYDEVIVEYYLTRLLRLRATFSDAQALNARAPFQRRERAGIDLLVFFSF